VDREAFQLFWTERLRIWKCKIFVYYTTLAKQKDVNVCDHRFTSVDTSQPAVNLATLVSTLPGSLTAAAELKVTSTIMSTVGVSKECLACDCTCQGFSDTFDTWPRHWGTAKNQPSAVKAWSLESWITSARRSPLGRRKAH
jgi:hypothetical protein